MVKYNDPEKTSNHTCKLNRHVFLHEQITDVNGTWKTMDDIHHEEQDDLYADLDVVPIASQEQNKRVKIDGTTTPCTTRAIGKDFYPSSSFRENQQSSMKSDLFTHMQQDIQRLEQKVAEYKTENEILKRNMGTLYRTAKVELDRKNRRIQELEMMTTTMMMMDQTHDS